MIIEVDSLTTMEALFTKEADPMRAMKLRMIKADKAMWMDMKIYKSKATAEGRRHRDTGRWCNRAFFNPVKAGVGTKKWLICYIVGKAGIWNL